MNEHIPIDQIAEEIYSKIDLPIRQFHDEKILLQQLAEKINYFIQHDFQYLVSLLYRLDVSESRLKTLLAENQQADAGLLIAQLIVHRQAEKIRTRRQFKQDSSSIPDDEKW